MRLFNAPWLLVVGLLALVSSWFPNGASQVKAANGDPYIVVLRNDVDERAVANEHARAHGVGLSHVYQHALRGYAARIPAAALERIRADSHVQFVAPDGVVQLAAQTLPTGVNRIEGERNVSTIGYNVPTAIIDTGIQSTHPDLNVVGGYNCIETDYEDGHGHGTHVAGTVGARNNSFGVVGVAPATPLYAVKVLDRSGNGSWSNVICGIDYVTQHAGTIKVANMSISGAGADDGDCGNANQDPVHVAICASVAAGVTYVVAAGNDTRNFQANIPASYNEVLTVTAMTDYDGIPGSRKRSGCLFLDRDDSGTDFSNFTTIGSIDEQHTIAAPGACIYSTMPGNGYGTKSGTSMAAPHVTGAVIRCLASGRCTGGDPATPTDDAATIIAQLRSDAAAQPNSYGFRDDPRSPNGNRYYGYLVSGSY